MRIYIYIRISALLSLEDAWCDSEITIMRLGEVERMCIQSRVGEDRTAGGRYSGQRERENENERRVSERGRKGEWRCNKVSHGRRKERP